MLSLRRATPRRRRCTAFRTYFYPRPPCRERLTNKRLDKRECNFYPRSPCGERPRPLLPSSRPARFLSTLSLRRATRSIFSFSPPLFIFLSTLSLRRATITAALAINGEPLFLSTLSLRRATVFRAAHSRRPLFLSTLSLRRATDDRVALVPHQQISIHALLAESDIGRIRVD